MTQQPAVVRSDRSTLLMAVLLAGLATLGPFAIDTYMPSFPAIGRTFGASPLYKFYEHVPHLFGLSTLEDQQAAGLIMKIGAGLLLWGIIAVVFFRWASEEERSNTPKHGLDEMDRELMEMGLRR